MTDLSSRYLQLDNILFERKWTLYYLTHIANPTWRDIGNKRLYNGADDNIVHNKITCGRYGVRTRTANRFYFVQLLKSQSFDATFDHERHHLFHENKIGKINWTQNKIPFYGLGHHVVRDCSGNRDFKESLKFTFYFAFFLANYTFTMVEH